MRTGRCVHIVDANATDRGHGAEVLRSAGYDVLTHPSGRNFLARQPDGRPGCILLDIHMPEPDGLHIQDELIASGVAMPVIVFTGDSNIQIAVRAMRAGALHFLEKPYADADLVNRVAEASARQGGERLRFRDSGFRCDRRFSRGPAAAHRASDRPDRSDDAARKADGASDTPSLFDLGALDVAVAGR